jgi:extracellular elastinolytic metalloproteinase
MWRERERARAKSDGVNSFGSYTGNSIPLQATIIRRKSPTRDLYPMGSWASHAKAGIRRYPYSTNLTINPETYKTLDSPGYWGVHAIGEVWAGMLYQVEEGLRSKWGWHPDLFPNDRVSDESFYLSEEEVDKLTGGKGRASKRPVPRHGNTLALALFVDSMKLQPCRPGLFDSRDAIILADKHLTGGANECLIWSRFAQRGLGTDASIIGQTPWSGIRKNGFKVPSHCSSEE